MSKQEATSPKLEQILADLLSGKATFHPVSPELQQAVAAVAPAKQLKAVPKPVKAKAAKKAAKKTATRVASNEEKWGKGKTRAGLLKFERLHRRTPEAMVSRIRLLDKMLAGGELTHRQILAAKDLRSTLATELAAKTGQAPKAVAKAQKAKAARKQPALPGIPPNLAEQVAALLQQADVKREENAVAAPEAQPQPEAKA